MRWAHLLLLACGAAAQTIKDGSSTIPATRKSVAPAAQRVSGSFNFPHEAWQLTPDVLANLTELQLTNISHFDFPSGGCQPQRWTCKTFPGDADWPSQEEWQLLNILTGGALIEGRPLAAPCWKDWPEYDEAKCADITAKWLTPDLHADYPVGIDWPLYEDITCQVPEYSGFNHTCTLGGMPSYVVDVANVAQVQIAVNFARNRNLRLVVKNSGHDFNSKSTGAGALSVWLKHLDQIDLVEDYDGGMAVRMGAGVDAIDLYEFCDVHDCRAVSGVVTTVGTAGGYSQGGGHSPLLGVKGLGSDQILSISVVLPDGSFVECNEQQNQDLFWAIRGGGGATFGIVTSMVFRVYPNAPIATVTYSFQNPTGSQLSVFWSGLEVFWASFPQFADAGQYRYFIVAVDPTTDTGIVNMTVHWGNDMTREELEAMNQPFFKNLTNVGIQINDINYQAFDSYLTAFNTSFPPYTADSMGTWVAHTASRLWPRGNWEDPAKFAVQNEVLKKHLEAGYILIAYNFMVAKNPEVNQDNSANPAWRDTLMHCMTPAIWTMSATPELVASASQNLTMSLNPWRAASPGSGAYMNEADINEPDFEQSFYGSYYPRLYQLKQQYDPWGLLYAITAVGSENWYITGQIPWYPTQNGRLCPVGP